MKQKEIVYFEYVIISRESIVNKELLRQTFQFDFQLKPDSLPEILLYIAGKSERQRAGRWLRGLENMSFQLEEFQFSSRDGQELSVTIIPIYLQNRLDRYVGYVEKIK